MWQILIGKLIEHSSISINSSNCLNLRNKEYNCQRCLNDCPKQAITITKDKVIIDKSTCDSCGICVHVCPTDVFHLEGERLIEYEKKIHEKEIVCFTCSKLGNRELDITLPCLQSLSIELIMIAIVKKLPVQIYWDPKVCKACNINWDQASLLDLINTWNDETNDQEKITIIDDPKYKRSNLVKISRREFFSTSTRKMKQNVGQFMFASFKENNIKNKIANNEKRKYLNQFIKSTEYMDKKITSDIARELSLSIIAVTEQCTLCDKCSTLCPTGALSTKTEKIDDNHKRLFFNPILCIDCKICLKYCDYLYEADVSNLTYKELDNIIELAKVDLTPCLKCGDLKNEKLSLCEECRLETEKKHELAESWLNKRRD